MPAAAGERRDGGKMLARQNFGRRHERRLPAGLDHMRRRDQRDHRLAGADVAVQQPQHALRLRQIGDDVGDRALLRRRERVGQRGDDARAQPALGGAAAAGARAHVRAQQCERELAGQQFVIGEPRPGRAFRLDVVGRLPGDGCCAARRRKPGKRCARARPRPAIPADPAGARARASIALRTWFGCSPSVSG